MKTTRLFRFIFFPLLWGGLGWGFLFFSCEKVISIDLNSADPKIVIEAEISDLSFCKVKLTQTVNFDQSNIFPPVTGATIIISDNSGNSETLTETSAGNYIGSAVTGISGRTYTLEIIFSGKTYTAVSIMSATVSIDTLIIETSPAHGQMAGKKYISVKYQDPSGITNYYRFIQSVNGIPKNDIFINEDRLENGQKITTPIITQNSSNLYSGDSVTVQLLTIDSAVYDYFRTLLQVIAGGHNSSGALPANPQTNFNNGALGYFSAHAIKSKSIVIQ